MSPTGMRQDLQTIQQSVAAGSVVVASTGTGPFELHGDEDAPLSRPVQRFGRITSHELIGSLHHHYCKNLVFGTHRLIGTLRRECLDHVLIDGERHLRRILTLYSLYYNETRTHLGLGKDTPLGRHIERSGTIVTTPILSGLHHRYARM
jgi:hypothetical protein